MTKSTKTQNRFLSLPYRKTVEIVRLMASPPDVQLSRFPVQACRPDELLFTFEEVLPFAKELAENNMINNESLNLLNLIDGTFEGFERNQWTESAICFSEKWQYVRTIARKILGQMGEEWKQPNLFWVVDVF